MEYDEESFSKTFKFIEQDQFKVDGRVLESRPGETFLKSLKMLPKTFMESVKEGLTEFENYLKKEFGNDVSFNYIVFERTGLVYQIRF